MPGKVKTIIFLGVLVVVSLAVAATSTFAWFVAVRPLGNKNFEAGSLDSGLVVEYWDSDSSAENKWTLLETFGFNAQIYPEFGDLSDVDILPENSDVFLKFKLNEKSGAVYKYQIKVASAVINVHSQNSDPTYTLQAGDFLDEMNYYNINEKLMCIDFSYLESDNANLLISPSSPTFSQTKKLSFVQQILSENEYVLGTKWLYVKLSLRSAEVLELVKRIPIKYMPYSVEFVLNIEGETRTLD